MAEAGPSSLSGTSVASVSPPESHSKQPAIQFPAEGSQSSLRDDKSHTAVPIGLGKPPILRNSSVKAAAHNSLSPRSEDGRRRVKSVEPPVSSHRAQRSIDGNGIAPRRSAISGRRVSRRAGIPEDTHGTSILSAFSDEYNLCELCFSVHTGWHIYVSFSIAHEGKSCVCL